MNIISGVYKIESISNPDRIYVGGSVNIEKRWSEHKRTLRLGNHDSVMLQNHVNEYGFDDLKFTLVTTCDKKLVTQNEQLHIDLLKPYFNVCEFANSMKGYKFTDRQIINLSNAHLGQPAWNKGKKWSDEAKLKMSISHTGKINGPHSEETRLKMKQNHKGMTGRKMTDEHKRKISEANLGKKKTKKPQNEK